jgi:arabinofuranosyltransferase
VGVSRLVTTSKLPWERAIIASGTLAGLASLALLAVRFSWYTLDDAFITFRYATNFAAGKGLVFNAGELPRAEGITSPLYSVLLAGAPAVGLDIEIFAKLLGLGATVLAGFCIGFMALAIVRRIPGASERLAKMCASAAILFHFADPYVAGNAVSGMETALGAASLSLFMFVLWSVISRGAESRRRDAILACSALLPPLFRPELGLAVMSMLLGCFVVMPARRRALVLATGLFGILGLAYFAVRFFYYDLLLPLPFYVKQSLGLHGLSDVQAFVRHSAASISLSAAVLFCGLVTRHGRTRPEGAFVTVVAVTVAAQLMYYATVRQIMGFGFRYFQPIVPAIEFLAAIGAACVWIGLSRRTAWSDQMRTLTTATVCVLPLVVDAGSYRAAKMLFVYDYPPLVEGNDRIGRAMADASGGRPLLLAINDCGVIPFRTRWPVIDLAGLNNRAIALAHDSNAAAREIHSKRPDLVVLVARSAHVADVNGWEHLTGSQLNDLGYSFQGDARSAEYYYLLLFARDTEATHSLVSRLVARGILVPP